MIHTIIYHGRYSLNFEPLQRFKGDPRYFTRKAVGEKVSALDDPCTKVNGIVFGYMQNGGEGLPAADSFFAVRVQDIVLEHAVKLVPSLHTDNKWFGPSPSQFGDGSAETLLKDIMEANPAQRADLMRTYRHFFGGAE